MSNGILEKDRSNNKKRKKIIFIKKQLKIDFSSLLKIFGVVILFIGKQDKNKNTNNCIITCMISVISFCSKNSFFLRRLNYIFLDRYLP